MEGCAFSHQIFLPQLSLVMIYLQDFCFYLNNWQPSSSSPCSLVGPFSPENLGIHLPRSKEDWIWRVHTNPHNPYKAMWMSLTRKPPLCRRKFICFLTVNKDAAMYIVFAIGLWRWLYGIVNIQQAGEAHQCTIPSFHFFPPFYNQSQSCACILIQWWIIVQAYNDACFVCSGHMGGDM